jgi:DNA polymerase-3 subunit epsilon
LPRRTLRALAGYFGAAVPPLRRSTEHVAATACLWRHLVALLAEREGILNLEDLREWLAQPARRSPRRFPLPRERRLELPDRPGVYRLLRAGGAVLYVGKAASLRHRVSSHFHSRAGERALEMLTQARDVACTETQTALEAALLESDEIKRLAPPFNVALAPEGRAVWYATAELSRLQERPDRAHPVGPLASTAPVEAFSALRAALALGGAPPLAVRARAVGVEPAWAPGPECFAAGLARFAHEHGPVHATRSLLCLGARLWALRRSEAEADPDGAEEPTAETPHRPAWDEERVLAALEETVVRTAHAVRRARWLVRLSECSLAWTEPGTEKRRLLLLQRGVVAARTDLPPAAPLPVPPGHQRTAADRRAAFDVATFDRLRVLTTELRGLAREAASIELRLGPHARLSRQRLQAVLRWV